ncbi:MAG TPA: hypothetical protein VK071_02045 [Tissierellales bacterium]|nr:hypothetical protein [Tissierellales bacterium]
MKNKKTLLLLLAVVMIFTVSGCGQKVDPEAEPVIGFYDAIKSDNPDSADDFIYFEDGKDQEMDFDLSEFGLEDTDDKELAELVFSELKYEINDIKKDGEKATVNVTVTSKDFSEIMGGLFKEVLSMEDLMFMDEKELNKELSVKLTEIIKNTDKTSDTTLDIKVVKKDGKWFIDGDDTKNAMQVVFSLMPGLDAMAPFTDENFLSQLEELGGLDDLDALDDLDDLDEDSKDKDNNDKKIVHKIPEDKEVFKEGVYKIGDKMPAGEYKVFASGDFSSYKVSTTSEGDSDDIIDMEIFSNNFYIKVEEGNYLELNGAFALKAKDAEPHKGEKGNGMYKVGFDIKPGEYEVVYEGDHEMGGYFEVKDGIGGEITNRKSFPNNAIFTVKEGDYLYISDDCKIVE